MLFLILFLQFLREPVIAPPGTIYLSDSIYIDKNVVTNEAWKEYVYFCSKEGKSYFLPDTSLYVNGKNYYLENNAKPVLLKSPEAVYSYIAWRNDFINTHLCAYSDTTNCKSAFYQVNSKKHFGVKYELVGSDDIIVASNKKLLRVCKYKEANQNTISSLNGSLFVFRCKAKYIPLSCSP